MKTPPARPVRIPRTTRLAACLLLLLAAGCLPLAIHPFYTDDDLIQDARILGGWVDEGGGAAWEFTAGAEQSYRLKVTEGETTGLYAVHLFKLADVAFLDLTQDNEAWEAAAKTNGALGLTLRTHLVARVRWAGDQPKIGWLSTDWLQKQLKEKPDLLPHQEPEDGPLVLTASTSELQAFLRGIATADDAWEDDTLLSRPPETAPE